MNLGVDRQVRHGAAAMHLRQQYAAGRHAHHRAVAGAQELRRQAGIFRRRQPQIEARRGCRRAGREVRRHGAGQPIAPIAAGIDRAEQQQDRQHRAQPPGVAPGEAGGGPADAQPAHRRRHPALVRRPQRSRRRVERRARVIGERFQRAVRQAARLLDAAPRRDPIGQPAGRHDAPSPPAGRRQREREGSQHAGMRLARQRRQHIEQRRRGKQAEDEQDGPQSRPRPLPDQRGAGQPEAPRQGALRRTAANHALPPRPRVRGAGRPAAGSSPSQSGTASHPSISS